MKTYSILISGLVLLSAGGCARLDYQKVPTPTQYSSWNDDNQRRADKMKGVRYYLPRPFLHLKQSTPVAQRVALASFRLDGKKYVLELPSDAPTWLKRAAPKHISITQALATSLAGGGNAPGQMRLQSTTAGDVTNGASASTSGGPNTVPTTNRPPSELHARTGFINETDPVTRLGDRMDVVYLPDFEEQYVIKPRIGLGTADIETRLRNGWAAEVFSQKVDNSNLIPYVIDQFERASEAAAGIFTTWAPVAAGLPPGTSPSKLLKMQSATAGEAEAAAKQFLGDVLIFKIAEVRIAQPGLYPILKPREIQQWLKYNAVITAGDPDATFEVFLKNAKTPWIRPDMAFIPCPPFTMIGFNVTADIFIAPATERVSDESVSAGGSETGQPGVDTAVATNEGKIKEALIAGKADLVANVSTKLDWGTLLVLPASNSTSISITFTQTIVDPDKASVEKALTDWAKKVLKVDPAKVEVLDGLAGGASSANVHIGLNLAEIVKKLQ